MHLPHFIMIICLTVCLLHYTVRDCPSPTILTIIIAGLCETHPVSCFMYLFLIPLPQNCSYPHSYMLSILAKCALLFCVYMFLIYAMAPCQIIHAVSFFSFSTTSYRSIPIAMSIPRPLLLTTVQHSKMDPHHI